MLRRWHRLIVIELEQSHIFLLQVTFSVGFSAPNAYNFNQR